MHYFGNYFGFQTNLILFFFKKNYFCLKLHSPGVFILKDLFGLPYILNDFNILLPLFSSVIITDLIIQNNST